MRTIAMRTIHVGWLLIAGLLITGCLESRLSSWEGKHRDELISAWGPPEKEVPLADGGARLVYLRGVVDRSMDYMCQMIFDTGKDGLIRSRSYYGCP